MLSCLHTPSPAPLPPFQCWAADSIFFSGARSCHTAAVNIEMGGCGGAVRARGRHKLSYDHGCGHASVTKTLHPPDRATQQHCNAKGFARTPACVNSLAPLPNHGHNNYTTSTQQPTQQLHNNYTTTHKNWSGLTTSLNKINDTFSCLRHAVAPDPIFVSCCVVVV